VRLGKGRNVRMKHKKQRRMKTRTTVRQEISFGRFG